MKKKPNNSNRQPRNSKIPVFVQMGQDFYVQRGSPNEILEAIARLEDVGGYKLEKVSEGHYRHAQQ